MMLRVVAALLALSLTTSAQTPPAPDAELARGIDLARQGELETAITTLDRVVTRLSVARGKQAELATAYLWLAVAHLGLDQNDAAKARLMEGLRADPALNADPKRFPPRVVTFFQQTRREFDEARARAVEPSPAPSPSPSPVPVAVKKKGGGKGLLIGAGAAAVVGVGVAAAGGGGGGGGAQATTTTQPVANTTSTVATTTTTTSTTVPPGGPTSTSTTTMPTTSPTAPPTAPPATPPTAPPTAPPSPPPCPAAPPTPSWVTPANGAVVQGPTTLRCDPQASAGCFELLFSARNPGGMTFELGRASGEPFAITWNTSNGTWPNGEYGLTCHNVAQNGSGSTAAVITVRVNNPLLTEDRKGDAATVVAWTTSLGARGAKGQIVWDGAHVDYVEQRRQSAIELSSGAHRVEATVVDAEGRPGTWAFTFAGRFRRGTLQVIAGEVARIGPDSIEFRVDGTAGERLVFRFESE